ncbi:Transposable element Tc3 transposase, partial [Camponotus floridanus]
NEEKQLNVALSVIEDCHSTVRKLHQQHNVSVGSIHNILTKKLKFHPYKVTLIHELNEDDPDRRIDFCETLMNRINADNNFSRRIVFSDEATFELNGNVNRHNMRYWNSENPNWAIDSRSTQHPQKVNVWAGIINNRIVGPFFIDGNLTAEKYERMLREDIIPAIQAIVGDDFERTWFQHDGAAPHYGHDVRAHLNNVFRTRWIGRRGSIEWPARSPDLTPLDYFLWEYLKNRVYQNKPTSVEELQQRIRQ